MKRTIKRAGYFLSSWLLLGGVILWLTLPNVSFTASTTSNGNSLAALNSQRQAALKNLHTQLLAGARFSTEEQDILRRFEANQFIPDPDADVLISRALYDYYVANQPLTKEQDQLLSRYTESVSRRDHDLADRKAQLLKAREDAAATVATSAAPLAPPANDTCAGAEVIPAGGPFPYLTAVTADITDATTTGDPPVPSCQSSVSRSIWYRITPSATATYTISTCADSGAATTVDDTVMAIYTSSTGNCGGTYTEIPITTDTDGCDDDSCASEAFQAVITTRLNAGTAYFIVIWEQGSLPPTPGNTAVQLRVTRILPPGNDTCAAPVPLTLNTPISGTTVSATDDYELSGAACFTGVGQTASTATGRDAVYSFTAPTTTSYSFRVTGYDSNKNLVLYVASTCPGGSPVTVGTCLAASNRDPSSTSEEIQCLQLGGGQQVFVFVDENALTAASTFTIEVTFCNHETEPNSTPGTANAVTLPVVGIEGSIGTAGDVDFYGLGTIAAGSRVFALVDGVAANAQDFDLRLTTATDTLQFDDNSNDAPFGAASPNIDGTPSPNFSSQLFLRVSNAAGAASEPYRLYAVVQPPGSNPGCNNCSATNETEPNNKTSEANSAANNYFYGSLSGPAPSTDIDEYRFLAQAGSLIYLGLDSDPLRNNTPINAQLELLDSSGTTLLLVNDLHQMSSTTSGAGSLTAVTPFSPGEALVYRVITSGTYYAKVSIGTSSSTSVGAGDYLLSISASAGTTLPFVDVLTSSQFYSSIAEAYFSGLANGTSETTFSPFDLVTREQMSAFITRAMDQALKRGSERATSDQNWTNQGDNNLALTTVGSGPRLVKSDGADLWVANSGGNSVSRVRASDGRVLETWTGATGATGVLVAMGKVFVTGSPANLYQIDPTQTAGAVTPLSSGLGGSPFAIAFDGQRIWTANFSGSVSIVTLNPFNVTNVSAGFNQPFGIVYDGANIWVADFGDNKLKQLGPGGNILMSVTLVNGPNYPAFDGTNIWVPNFLSNNVSVVRAVGGLAGTVIANLTGNGLSHPTQAAFDGERIMVTNQMGNSVSLWRASDLTPVNTFSTGASTAPIGVCSDGLNFWITLSSTGKLARF